MRRFLNRVTILFMWLRTLGEYCYAVRSAISATAGLLVYYDVSKGTMTRADSALSAIRSRFTFQCKW